MPQHFLPVCLTLALLLAVGCADATPVASDDAKTVETATDEVTSTDGSSADADAPVAGAKADVPKPDADGWYELFDGKTLNGWTIGENKKSWRIEEGELVANGPPAHLFYSGPVANHDFKNFELQADVFTKPNSNSGIYLHTKFQEKGWPAYGLETQVNNTHPDPRKTGSLYRAQDVMDDSPAKDNEWFTMNITVKDKHVVVKVNDKVVNDYTQPEDPPHEPGWENNELSDGGTIALQAHDDGSTARYRNIRIKPLP